MTRKPHEIKAEISALRSEISNLYNQSQWASTSALDSFDDAIGAREDRISDLYVELSKAESQVKSA
jgi:hypothetical protein